MLGVSGEGGRSRGGAPGRRRIAVFGEQPRGKGRGAGQKERGPPMNELRNLNDGRLAFLRRIPLFSEFEDGDFQEMERLVQLQTVARGSYVYVPGDAGEQVYLLRSGRIKISKSTPEGKEWILTLVEPGE